MHTLVQICHLSLRDYLHERLLSACAVLGLAAVLAPLLILCGVKFGVVETLTERLRSDPATLVPGPLPAVSCFPRPWPNDWACERATS